MILEFSRQIFEKSSNIKFHENLSIGSRVVPCGPTDDQTDRRDEANGPNFAYKPKNMPKQEKTTHFHFSQGEPCRYTDLPAGWITMD